MESEKAQRRGANKKGEDVWERNVRLEKMKKGEVWASFILTEAGEFMLSRDAWWTPEPPNPGEVGCASIYVRNHHLPFSGLFPGDAAEPPWWTPEAAEIKSWKIRAPQTL